MVEVIGLLRGRGRPRKIYALAEKADRLFPHSYDALALDLLEAITRLPDGAQLLNQILAARREIWRERYARRLSARSLDEKLAEVAVLFNEKGGLTDFAPAPDGTYLLTKRNCNISAVTSQHPEFCEEERSWLQEVLQTPVESLYSRAAGDAACTFQIRPAADAAAAVLDHGSASGG
jgi:predicted ArsR family transcriptional regulator